MSGLFCVDLTEQREKYIHELIYENGQIVVSSRMVAERFGKRHDHVIRAIEDKIKMNPKLGASNYYLENTYIDSMNRPKKEYLMTRDGFTFIVMGFTGKDADDFKMAYIEAFNKMEEIFKSQMPAPVNTKERTIEEVINIKEENGEILVSGRELHEFLEIGTEYAKWFSRMAEYGFEENEDYVVIVKNDENPKGGRPSVNHAMKIDMAKEISMLQRNEKGKEARQYFIKCEKKLREMVQKAPFL